MPTSKAEKSKVAKQPASYSKNSKITDEKDLFFIGAVLDEVIAEWSDENNPEQLDDLADFNIQLKEKSGEYKVVEDDLGEFSLAEREKNEPKTVVQANFIELSNNPNSKVGVNYSFEGASATASSTEIAKTMSTATGEKYQDNQYSIGSLCRQFGLDKNEEEEKLLKTLQSSKSRAAASPGKQKKQEQRESIDVGDPDDLELPEETKAPTSSNRKKALDGVGELRTAQQNTNSEENVSEVNKPTAVDIENDDSDDLDLPKETNTKAATNSNRKKALDEVEQIRPTQQNANAEESDEEDKVVSKKNPTSIEAEFDDLDDEQIDGSYEDDETFTNENFESFFEEIDSLEQPEPVPQKPAPKLETTNSNLEAAPTNESKDTEETKPEKPKRKLLEDIATNRELGAIGEQLTSAGPGINGFNEMGLATQGVQFIAALADWGADSINNFIEEAKKKGQAEKLKEIIELAQSTSERIDKDDKRLEAIHSTETSVEQKGIVELVQSTSERIDKSEERLEVIQNATSQSAGSQTPSSQTSELAEAGSETGSQPVSSSQPAGSQANAKAEASEKGAPETEVASEKASKRSQTTEQPDTPESASKQPHSNKSQPEQNTSPTVPTADISAKVDRLAKNVGLSEPVTDKLEIDEKASIDEQLKQIKQYLTNMNKKLDKIEQRLEAMEEKLGITKAEKNLQGANPMSADPMADYIDERTQKTVKTTTAADLSESLTNYAKAAKEYASSKGQNPGDLVMLPVGDNELVADFRKPQTSINVTSKDGEELFAASGSDGKNSKVNLCNLDKEEKNLIVDLPQTKEEFGQLISAQSAAKSVLDFSNATGVDKFKVAVPDSSEKYSFKVEKDKNTGKTIITGTDTNNPSEPVFLATIKGKDSPSIEKNEISEEATSAMSIKLSQRANQKAHQEAEEQPRQPVKASQARETAQAEL